MPRETSHATPSASIEKESIMKRTILLALAGLLVAGAAMAHEYSVGSIKIGHPWSRPTPAGAVAGGGFLTITNTGKQADRLVSGVTPAADRLEIHEMSVTDGIMRMRALPDGLVIPPGQTVKLAPGGFHIMLIGLKRPLALGDHVPARLKFEKAGEVDVSFLVSKPPADVAAPSGMSGMEHH
jgi:copper(I)-binding protein